MKLSDSVLLQRLTQLTYLEVGGASEAALAPLSGLSKLQHINVTEQAAVTTLPSAELQELRLGCMVTIASTAWKALAAGKATKPSR